MLELTTQQVARMLGISNRRVIALIQAKRLPAEKIGGAWFVKPQDVILVKVRKQGYPKGRPRKPRS